MLKPRVTAPCTHDRRPGTSICLYCLQEARAATRRRRKRVIARLGVATMGGGVLVALVVGAFVALAPDAGSRSRSVNQAVSRAIERATPMAVPQAAAPASSPVVPVGRRSLGDGIVAERIGDTVIVHFDTEQLRTRFDWKFEGVLRGTLPLMFGDLARLALDSIPHGELLRGADLLRQLPRSGLAIRGPGEAVGIMVWPVVRPGRDGPLVVAYKAVRRT